MTVKGQFQERKECIATSATDVLYIAAEADIGQGRFHPEISLRSLGLSQTTLAIAGEASMAAYAAAFQSRLPARVRLHSRSSPVPK